MIPELGHFALMLSLVICLVQGVLPLAGTFLKIRSWVDLARPAAVANALFLTIASESSRGASSRVILRC